jgi:hypothetical protein
VAFLAAIAPEDEAARQRLEFARENAAVEPSSQPTGFGVYRIAPIRSFEIDRLLS